jgi:hypothetical protein
MAAAIRSAFQVHGKRPYGKRGPLVDQRTPAKNLRPYPQPGTLSVLCS